MVSLLATDLVAQDAAAQTRTLSLRDAMVAALRNSKAIDGAEARVRGADQQVREAWSNVLPDITTDFAYTRNVQVQEGFLPAFIFDPEAPPNELVPVRFGSDNTWRAGISLSQALFELDVFIGLGAADRFRALEQERYRGTTQNVVTNVRQRYFDGLVAQAAVLLIGRSVERLRETLEETRALNRAGLSSNYDVLRIEVQLANIEPDLRRAGNAVLAAKRQLLVEIGMSPETPIELEGALVAIDVDSLGRNEGAQADLIALSGIEDILPNELDEAYTVARQQRSDLRQIRLDLILEEAQRNAQKADFFPKLSLFANYQVLSQQNDPVNFFGQSNHDRVASRTSQEEYAERDQKEEG